MIQIPYHCLVDSSSVTRRLCSRDTIRIFSFSTLMDTILTISLFKLTHLSRKKGLTAIQSSLLSSSWPFSSSTLDTSLLAWLIMDVLSNDMDIVEWAENRFWIVSLLLLDSASKNKRNLNLKISLMLIGIYVRGNIFRSPNSIRQGEVPIQFLHAIIF